VQPAAGVARARVREGLDEAGEGVALPQRVRVREREQLAARGPHGRVLRAHLALARQVQDDVGARRAGARRGGVGGAVHRDDDLEPVARPVERERVAELRPRERGSAAPEGDGGGPARHGLGSGVRGRPVTLGTARDDGTPWPRSRIPIRR
jgi:hypothetical protein